MWFKDEVMKMRMKLKEMLDLMEKAIGRYELSDDYREAHGYPKKHIGEYQYGVSMVPCDWVYPYLKVLATDERLSEIVKEIDMKGIEEDK